MFCSYFHWIPLLFRVDLARIGLWGWNRGRLSVGGCQNLSQKIKSLLFPRVDPSQWLTTGIYSLMVLEIRCLKSGCWQVLFLLEMLRENLVSAFFLPSESCWQSWHYLVCRHTTSISASIIKQNSPWVSVLRFLSSYKDISHWLGPTLIQRDLLFSWFHLQKPCFQIRSHSEVHVGYQSLEDPLSTPFNRAYEAKRELQQNSGVQSPAAAVW